MKKMNIVYPGVELPTAPQPQNEILQAAQQNGLEKHIKFLGVITDKTALATVYEAADVHVFPVRHIPDDPEGFGMVAIEAAAHGLPTVAFATGGIVDAVGQSESGYLVEKDNYVELGKQVLNVLLNPMKAEDIQAFAQQFAWRKFGQSIVNAFC